MTYQPDEPPLTAEEQAAIDNIKRRAARRQAAKELATQRRQPGAVIVVDREAGTHEVVSWGAPS